MKLIRLKKRNFKYVILSKKRRLNLILSIGKESQEYGNYGEPVIAKSSRVLNLNIAYGSDS